jgi:hypothetical protein
MVSTTSERNHPADRRHANLDPAQVPADSRAVDVHEMPLPARTSPERARPSLPCERRRFRADVATDREPGSGIRIDGRYNQTLTNDEQRAPGAHSAST